jgi:hypothetical protein
MAQTYAGVTRFSADVNVSKNRKYWGIPAGFQILSTKENEVETKWRRMQSRANCSLRLIPDIREKYREFS